MPALRVAIPTKDRQGNVALAISSVALHLGRADELFLYDDGDRPAISDYGTRFALDIALQRGARVEVIRGKPQGIAKARARILKDAFSDRVQYLRMIDDDIVVPASAWDRVWRALGIPGAQYAVPTIRLANNEAGIEGFGKVKESSSVHDSQFVLGGTGVHRMPGGAWTCDIALNLYKFDVEKSISDLSMGPPVVEDYVLTAPLIGYVDYEAEVWHCMSPDQGERAWNSEALAFLRKQLGQKS
jgi:glycosyltransferase involved in cell wall biosynthesis